MDKVILDWKAPSERKMVDLVATLTPEEKKDFAENCTDVKEGKRVVNKSRAKKWVKEKFANDENVEWKNLPEKRTKKPTISDTLEDWLK